MIEIRPFNYRYPPEVVVWALQSDDFILQNFSTSPDVEPEHFASDMRRVFQFVATNPFPMHSIFSARQSLKFSLSHQGEWHQVEV